MYKNHLIPSLILDKNASTIQVLGTCWLPVFIGACIAGCNELVFGCCQQGSTRARCVFGYLRADVESNSHDSKAPWARLCRRKQIGHISRVKFPPACLMQPGYGEKPTKHA
jgi:hypothetical protein